MATETCSYASPAARKKKQSQSATSPDDMQDRINRLEGLVLSMMHGAVNMEPLKQPSHGSGSFATGISATDSTSPSIPEDLDMDGDGDKAFNETKTIDESLAASIGTLKVDPDMGKPNVYVGHEHWHTILSGIAEVKTYFNNHKCELENSYKRVKASKPASSLGGPTLLLGAETADEEEIRASVPSKSTVFTLCSRYFNSADNAVAILHSPSFQEQLRSHWRDPSKTPIVWLGLLYSIMCLATLSYQRAGDSPPEWKDNLVELASEYRLRTVQCLMKADYTKPTDYTIETMLLYMFGEHMARWNADLGLWMIVGMITRVAFRMGYHRDAKWFPNVTPFEAEMRRRNWAMVRMLDTIYSHHVSLPSMIVESNCDTHLPNNIYDEDFGPETKVLPPSRPNTEPTPVAYIIAKAKFCNELGNILQTMNSVRGQVPYDEILRFDAKLDSLMDELPPHLTFTPLGDSLEPKTVILSRFSMDILYRKILCVLHRKFLTREGRGLKYVHSRRKAIDASLTMLRHLSTLYRESQPNGRLRAIRWHVASMATRDFALPTLLVVIDLHCDHLARMNPELREKEGFLWTDEERAEMFWCLEETKNIWKELAEGSLEAYKAFKIVELMLETIKKAGFEVPERQAGSTTQQNGAPDVTISGEPAASDPINGLAGDLMTGADPFAIPSMHDFGGMFENGAPPLQFAIPGFDTDVSSSVFNPGPLSGTGEADPFAFQGAPSPFSMFTNMGSTDMSGQVDWVGLPHCGRLPCVEGRN